MATITSAASGNFSAGATWVGGVVPGAADIAVAATGHVIAIDVDVTVSQVQQAGTGKFTLGNGRTLSAGVVANAGTASTGGTVEVTATTTAAITGTITGSASSSATAVVVSGTGTITITGNVVANGNSGNLNQAIYLGAACTLNLNGSVFASGRDKRGIYIPASTLATVNITGNVQGQVNGEGIYSLSPNTVTVVGSVTAGGEPNFAGAYAISMQAGGTLNITGTVTGGSTRAGHFAVFMANGSGSINVTGNVIGGTSTDCWGIYTNSSNTSCTVTGNATGGNGAGAHAIYSIAANFACTVTGNITGSGATATHGVYATGSTSVITVTGTVTAANPNSHGIRCDATSSGSGVVLNGNLVDAPGGAVAVWCRFLRVSPNTNSFTRYANSVGFPNGGLVSRVSPDNVTGMPASGNVRHATVYGYNNELTGTLRVPPASSVASGVPVDATTGTAALSPADVAALVGAQIAAALNSTP